MNKFLVITILVFFPVFAFAQDTTDIKPSWEGSANIGLYFFRDDFIAMPVIQFDKNRFHLEARYNYESKETFPFWGGYNFSGGNKLEYEFTPIIGIVTGEVDGIAPGLETTLGFRNFEFYSESEYIFDFNNSDNTFFYTWTDLTWSPIEWGWIGISGQRTHLFDSDVELQHGILAGGGFKNWELTGYWYNPATKDWYFIVAASWSF